MALEQKLNLRLSQKLIMTPSLQQAIKLLQMTKLEIQEEITQELTENPLLAEVQEAPADAERQEGEEMGGEAAETGESEAAPAEAPAEAAAEPTAPDPERDSFDEIDYESYFQDYMDLSYIPQGPAEEIETRPLDAVLSRPQSLHEHLQWQLEMAVVPPVRKEIAQAIIGNIDESGYLQASFDELCALGHYPLEEVEMALHLVQDFDPPGVGARDLRECLLLQIAFHDMEGTPVET